MAPSGEAVRRLDEASGEARSLWLYRTGRAGRCRGRTTDLHELDRTSGSTSFARRGVTLSLQAWEPRLGEARRVARSSSVVRVERDEANASWCGCRRAVPDEGENW